MQHNLRLASNTVEAYGRSLDDFLAFCEREGIEPEDADREQIALYVGDLASRPNPRGAKVLNIGSGAGLSNATMQLRLTAVRLFYDHPVERGLRKEGQPGRAREVHACQGVRGQAREGPSEAQPEAALDPLRR